KPTYQPIDRQKYCERHAIRDFGIFKDQRLVAYCRVHVVGEFAVFGTILGHVGHLKFGIMDLLVREIVKVFLAEGRKVRAINYLHMRSTTQGLTAFKESVGFRSRRTVWVAARRPPRGSESLSPPRPIRSQPRGAAGNRFAELIQGKTINKIVMRGDC